jgi:hypothetical protein
MIKNLPQESTMISDTDATVDIPEQAIIVANYEGSDCVGLISYDGEEVVIPYRMVKEVIKVKNQYVKNKANDK